MWGAGLAAAFVIYFATCMALGRIAIPLGYFVVGLVYSSVFAWSVAAFTSVERVEHYECAWKVDARGIEVDLSPIGFGWSPVDSAELADKLRKDQPPKVCVDVPVVRDFGQVRARGAIQRVDGIRVQEPSMLMR